MSKESKIIMKQIRTLEDRVVCESLSSLRRGTTCDRIQICGGRSEMICSIPRVRLDSWALFEVSDDKERYLCSGWFGRICRDGARIFRTRSQWGRRNGPKAFWWPAWVIRRLSHNQLRPKNTGNCFLEKKSIWTDFCHISCSNSHILKSIIQMK